MNSDSATYEHTPRHLISEKICRVWSQLKKSLVGKECPYRYVQFCWRGHLPPLDVNERCSGSPFDQIFLIWSAPFLVGPFVSEVDVIPFNRCDLATFAGKYLKIDSERAIVPSIYGKQWLSVERD